MNAPAPARASCASDTWPAYPVTTTSERARIAKMMVVITAARAEPLVMSNAIAPATKPTTIGMRYDRGRGARPRCVRSSVPRSGTPRLVMSSAMSMTMRGTTSPTPDCGIHE